MNYYKYIVNPITKKKIDIESASGVQLLKSYIGGSNPALNQITTSKRVLSQKTETIKDLETELNQKKETISGLESDIEHLHTELEHLDQENGELDIKNNKLNLSNQTLNQELEPLRYQLETTISKHDDCLKKLKLSDKKTATLKTENSQLKLMNKQDGETIKSCHDDLEHLESEISLINQTNGDLEEQLNILDSDNKKLLKENNKLQDELEACQSKLQSIEPYMDKVLASLTTDRAIKRDIELRKDMNINVHDGKLDMPSGHEVLSNI